MAGSSFTDLCTLRIQTTLAVTDLCTLRIQTTLAGLQAVHCKQNCQNKAQVCRSRADHLARSVATTTVKRRLPDPSHS